MRFALDAQGDTVTSLQRFLAMAGHYQGQIDSWFGPRTESSIRAWQSELGLDPTGVWDEVTNSATVDILRGV